MLKSTVHIKWKQCDSVMKIQTKQQQKQILYEASSIRVFVKNNENSNSHITSGKF